MAEGVCRSEMNRRGFDDIAIDSAGTSDWHIENAPDARAIAAAARRDVDIADQKARQIRDSDFDEFDFILAMDGSILAKLRGAAGEHRQGKVRLFLDFARDLAIREVGDPYYGGDDGFDDTLDLLEIGVQDLADHIERSRS